MKILFVIPSLAKGGQEKAGMLLCNYLMNFHEVTAVCFEAKNKDDFDYQCRVERIDIPSSDSLYGKSLAALKRVQALKKLKQQIKPDCSIAFGNTAIILNGLTGVGEKRISSVRQSFVSLMESSGIGLKAHRWLYVRGLKRSDKIVSVSSDINKELKKYFNINNNCYVNNGFDIKYLQQQAQEPVVLAQRETTRLVHAGRFDSAKGHWHLVRIFVEIKKMMPATSLLLLGEADYSTTRGAEIITYCKNYLEQNGLTWSEQESSNADVLFLGHQKNPHKYFFRSQLFVFPSIWEGFPNALVEAMCAGIPVAAGDCPTGPKDILIDDRTGRSYGLLLKAFDDDFDESVRLPDSNDLYWAQQLIGLLNNAAQMQAYKKLSQERASHFDIEEMGKKWNEIISR